MDTNKTILYTLISGICIAGLWAALDAALSLPDVQYSYKTNECITVLNYADSDNYSCENLPSKFNHVWVQ